VESIKRLKVILESYTIEEFKEAVKLIEQALRLLKEKGVTFKEVTDVTFSREPLREDAFFRVEVNGVKTNIDGIVINNGRATFAFKKSGDRVKLFWVILTSEKFREGE